MPEPVPAPGPIRFGAFEVDVRAGELRKHGIRIKLQDQPFRLLQILLGHPGEVVTREELQRQIWPSDTFVDFDRGLNNAVKRLREALADSADEPRFIETLPKRGYRFIAAVQAPEISRDGERRATPSPTDSSSAVVGTQAAPRPLWQTSLLIVGTAATLLLLGLAFRAGGFRDRVTGRASAAQRIRSIAVLPLQNLSGDPTQEYFADAMTEELITELSGISALNVISRTSVMRYKSSKQSLPEIARELNADAVVEGSITRSGDRMRITAQLISSSKDHNIWAQTYDRDLRDTLTLQSEVARAITDEIKVKLTATEQQRLQSPRPQNHDAVMAHLEGRAHLDSAVQLEFQKNLQKETQQEWAAAAASFERAIREDPNYPQAYLDFFVALQTTGNDNGDSLQFLARAREGIDKALSLDDTLTDAHIYKARYLSQYEWNWAAAEKELKRALSLSPNSARAHQAYADYLMSTGRQQESDQESELAAKLDPQCSDTLFGLDDCFSFDEQLKYLQDTGKSGKLCFLYAGMGKEKYLLQGKYPEAIDTFQKMMKVCGYPELAQTLARNYVHGDYRAAIRAWTAGMEKEIANGQPIPNLWMAFMYSAINDRDSAFRWLEKAYANHSWCILYLKDDHIWDPIRSDPRFRDLVRRAGLPE